MFNSVSKSVYQIENLLKVKEIHNLVRIQKVIRHLRCVSFKGEVPWTFEFSLLCTSLVKVNFNLYLLVLNLQILGLLTITISLNFVRTYSIISSAYVFVIYVSVIIHVPTFMIFNWKHTATSNKRMLKLSNDVYIV